MEIIQAVISGLSAALLYELVVRVRKFLDVAYVPIYFSFLPLEVLNRDLSLYLGDDFFLGPGEGEKPNPAEAKRLKRRIVRLGAAAAAVSSVILPGVTGFSAAFYMPRVGLWPALAFILLRQGFLMATSIRDFYSHALIADPKTISHLRIVYFLYLSAILYVFHTSYAWTRPYVEKGDFSGLAGNVIALLIGKVLVIGILVALVAQVFLASLTDRHIPTLDDKDGNDG